MKNQSKFFFLFTFALISFHVVAQNDYLKNTWTNQVEPIGENYLTFSFTEELNELGHSFYPWQQTNYKGNGQIWCNSTDFIKNDTLRSTRRIYNSKTVLSKNDMLYIDYGDEDLFKVTHEMYEDQAYKTARYIPTRIINYFKTRNISIDSESNEEYAVYKTVINKSIVTLYINKSTNLLDKITTMSDDDLFGDVTTTYTYSNYISVDNLNLALDIMIQKIDGKILDEVHLKNAILSQEKPTLLDRPTDYALIDEIPVNSEIKTEKYTENIHFVELIHTDDKVMIAEFSDFLLVAEAPLNSENGELIIQEARKIAPNKPIKYFVFGHYHPHYIGGVRAFVHKGAKVIASDINKEYVSYIVNAKHTINPDSLQLEPKPLIIEEIKDSLTISDKQTEMKIYFIGEKSVHTRDYLIYYFPKEKLLFQGDLVWIPREGEIKKARSRQAGLYNAIMDLGIEVETIIQSWPVADHGVKTIIPFSDLEKSMTVE